MSTELLLYLTTPNDTLSRLPLDEGSARRRDLYVTTQQKDTPAPASERPQTHAFGCTATEAGQCDRTHVTNSLRGVRTPHSRWPTRQQVNERDPRTSQSNYILITDLMHWLLFIHKILFSFTCFEPQVLIFRMIQLYTRSIWYCHSLWEFVVACRYTAWVRTDCRGKVVGRAF